MLDESATPRKVSLVPTREPILYWEQQLKDFPVPPVHAGVLNSRLEGITPHGATTGEDVYRSGWRCPSLLKAMYLMLHLDKESRTKIIKCKAPGCLNYFRAGPKSRRTTYCPPPPGKQQSKCASRGTSRDSRERKRRQS